MNILIAPDSFKGSMTAIEFCQIAVQQIHTIDPDALLLSLPMADGGEGTIDAMLSAVKGTLHSVRVRDPLAHIIDAHYAVLDDNTTAVIEMARASGLPLIKPGQRNPMLASSYGTGELILAALAQGCRRFIMGLGGSATNDGGSGMLQALGVKFFDSENRELNACGQTLAEINSIDISAIDSRLNDCEFIIAGDVINPLLGERGATLTFGPQKGADQAMLQQLESGMQHFVTKTSDVLASADSIALMQGAGAAGGMGFGLMAYCQASMSSGFELIADMTELDNLLAAPDTRPDLIISGEGSLDSQSLDGKVIGRLCQRAEKYQIPIALICGHYEKELDLSRFSSKLKLYSLCSESVSIEYSMNHSADLLKKMIAAVVEEHQLLMPGK